MTDDKLLEIIKGFIEMTWTSGLSESARGLFAFYYDQSRRVLAKYPKEEKIFTS